MELIHDLKKPGAEKSPADWKIVDLSDFCTLQRGFDITEATRVRGEIPVFSSSGFAYFHNQAMVQPPGVVTGRKGILGKVFLIDEPFWPHDTTLWVKDFRGNAPAYVARVLQHFHLERLDAATSVPTLNRNNLAGYTIAIPPTKAEQEAIAQALSDADALIESLEKLLAKKRHIKHGAIQDLLTGKKRLPGFDGEWVELSLGEIGKCHRGVSYNPAVHLFSSDGTATFRLLRSNNVQDATIVLSDMQYVASERVSENQRLQLNDILICMANGSRNLVGKAGRFLVDDGFHYTFGAFMGCFRPNKEKVDPRFAFYLFHTEKYRLHIDLLLAGSSINNLTPSSVEALVNKVPFNRDEQNAIVTILSDMDEELAALEGKLTKLRQTKQGMMQELLTGRIRLV